MNEKLLKKYLKYAGTDEAFAVLFAKKHIEDTRGHWVDVVDCRRYEMSSDNLHFRFVVGGLYRRKIQPQYPSKSRSEEHTSELQSRPHLVCRLLLEKKKKNVE